MQSGQQGDTAIGCVVLRWECHLVILNIKPGPAIRRSIHTIGERQTSVMTEGWLAGQNAIIYICADEADSATALRI